MDGCLTFQKHPQHCHDRQFPHLGVHLDEPLVHPEHRMVLNLERHLDEDHRNLHDLDDLRLASRLDLPGVVHLDEDRLRLDLPGVVRLDEDRPDEDRHR